MVLAGYLWASWLPIIKNIWTSSYVLVAGGYSAILLAVFFLVIDAWGLKKWAFFFMVIGLNPIAIYMLSGGIIDYESATRFLFGGVVSWFSQAYQPVIHYTGFSLLTWLTCYFMYKKKIFIKV
ncbi:MAG: hypothetical protein HC896_09780 [Bacteroidales bacterium]|nr:hypothetical protein [Bacteroidales bacterium]